MKARWAWLRLEMHILWSLLTKMEPHIGCYWSESIPVLGGRVLIPVKYRFIGCQTCKQTYYEAGK